MKKQNLSEELSRMKRLAGLINENDSAIDEGLEKYSNDALTDMIINLSRFEGNEEEIMDLKKELLRRKKDKDSSRVNLKDMEVGETIKINKSEDLAPFYLKLDSSGQAVSDLPELEGMIFSYNGVSISRLK